MNLIVDHVPEFLMNLIRVHQTGTLIMFTYNRVLLLWKHRTKNVGSQAQEITTFQVVTFELGGVAGAPKYTVRSKIKNN